MNTETLMHTALMLHLMALVLAVGVMVSNIITFRNFWKLYDVNRQQGLSAFRAYLKIQMLGMIGLALAILSGLTMLGLLHWTLVDVLWFKIKLSMVVLLFVNGFTIGRTTTLKLEALLKEEKDNSEINPDTLKLRRNIQIFQFIQLSLFAIIIVLAAFRFN